MSMSSSDRSFVVEYRYSDDTKKHSTADNEGTVMKVKKKSKIKKRKNLLF